MRRLLGIICLFRCHKPVPCPCALCRAGSFGLHARHCERCGTLVRVESVARVLTKEHLDDLLQEMWDAGGAP